MTTALEDLYNDVVARFAAESYDVPNYFGFREWAQQLTRTGRIVWTPGDESGGFGAIGAGKYPGGNPRRLATIGELFTVSISGVDPNDPENELAQYRATRTIVDAWIRAVYLAASGRYQLISTDWDRTKKERQYGMAVRIVGTINSYVYDSALDEVGPPPLTPNGVRVNVDVTELDLTETIDNGVTP